MNRESQQNGTVGVESTPTTPPRQKQGRPSAQDILERKNNHHCITISLSIPSRLLDQIDALEGKSTSAKIVKCATLGFPLFSSKVE